MVSINSSSQNLWSIIGQAQERKSAMEAARAAAHAPKSTLDEKGKAQEQLQQRVENAEATLRWYYWQKAQLEELSRPEIKAEELARGRTEKQYQDEVKTLRQSIKDFEEDVANGGPKIFAKDQLSGPLFKLGEDGFYTIGGVSVTGPYGIKIDVPVSRAGYDASQEYIRSIESRATERTEKDVSRATESLNGTIMAMQAVVRRHNELVGSLQPERLEALRQTQGDAAVREYQDAARLALADIDQHIAQIKALGQSESNHSLSGQILVKGNDGLYQFGEFTLGLTVAQVSAQIDQSGVIKVARDGENFQREGSASADRLVLEGHDEILSKDQAYFDGLVKSYLKNNEIIKTDSTQEKRSVDLAI